MQVKTAGLTLLVSSKVSEACWGPDGIPAHTYFLKKSKPLILVPPVDMSTGLSSDELPSLMGLPKLCLAASEGNAEAGICDSDALLEAGVGDGRPARKDVKASMRGVVIALAANCCSFSRTLCGVLCLGDEGRLGCERLPFSFKPASAWEIQLCCKYRCIRPVIQCCSFHWSHNYCNN